MTDPHDPLAGEAPREAGARVPGAREPDPRGPAPGVGEPAAGTAGAPGAEELAAALAERTGDLQRLQAEYVNYRRRVERDRLAVQEQAVANVLATLLPVLDDVGRAREHGELEGGFKAVAEALESATGKLGLARFGEVGEPFDPTVHEALTYATSGEVAETTAVAVFAPGYRLGERVLRPARVAVAEPDPAAAAGPPVDGEPGGDPATTRTVGGTDVTV